MSRTTVLIVEDEAIVAADLAGKLQGLGYQVAGVTAHGQEAVALACRLRPHFVLMDISLEGPIDGIEAAEAIRRDHDVPIIYLTAHSDAATLARAKLTGPFGYILKPFEERELATQIELALYKHRADRELREQREWLRVTLRSIGDAVIATDDAARIVFLNPVAESLTGWTSGEAAGQPIPRVFRIVNEQTGEPLEEPVARVLREGRTVELANHAALVTKDGRTVPIEDSAAPILDAAGRVIGAVLVFHDVTEKRRAEEAVRELNETLEEQVAERTAVAERRARDLRRLAAELSHAEHRERTRLAKLLHDDLQQLLLAARLHISALIDGPRDQVEQHIATIDELVQTCQKTSRNLTQELSPPILQCGTLADVIEWLGGWFGERHGLQVAVEIRNDLLPTPEPLRVFLFQAVRELLVNVIKHSGKTAAKVGLFAQNGQLSVQVEDDGEQFDPRAVETRLQRPEGFGLFNIRERVDAFGGRLEIQATPRGGACFRLVMPVAEEPETLLEDGRLGAEVAPGPARTPRARGGAVHLMIVDDHTVVREGFVSLLDRQPDFEVIGEAADGEQAVQQAEALRPDVIVMDVNMPTMDGVEATRRIKSRQPGIVIVGLSLFEDEAVARAMVEAGADTYVSKHAPAEDVVEAIRGDCSVRA